MFNLAPCCNALWPGQQSGPICISSAWVPLLEQLDPRLCLRLAAAPPACHTPTWLTRLPQLAGVRAGMTGLGKLTWGRFPGPWPVASIELGIAAWPAAPSQQSTRAWLRAQWHAPYYLARYGWSDVAVNPTTVRRTPLALDSLLQAAGEPGPFILAGHSAGGDMALQYAALFAEKVTGLVLMDAYTDAVITLQTGYAYTGAGVLTAIDAYRAVSRGLSSWMARRRHQTRGAMSKPCIQLLWLYSPALRGHNHVRKRQLLCTPTCALAGGTVRATSFWHRHACRWGATNSIGDAAAHAGSLCLNNYVWDLHRCKMSTAFVAKQDLT